MTDGVATGDVVECPSLPTPEGRGVVIGFVVAHPTLPERCYMLRPGDNVKKLGPWPPGGALSAEEISRLVRRHKR